MRYNIVAIFKDEAPYLAEWIEFHRLQGFDRFLLYDNGSVDMGDHVARAHGAEVIHWPGQIQQLFAYNDAAMRIPMGEWTAFIDIDEYLHCPDGTPVVDMVAKLHDSYGWSALGVPWQIYGSNGHHQKPPGLTIEEYTRREEGVNQHVKQIIRIGSYHHWRDPHHTDAQWMPAYPHIVCNHYWTRSAEECVRKFDRGRADHPVKRSLSQFWDHEQFTNAVEDTTIAANWRQHLRNVLDGAR